MINRTELLDIIGPLGIDADGWAEEMADRILALDRRACFELSEDDAKLILNALSAYRWVLLGQTGHDDGRIHDISARIIWRKEDA